MRNEAGKFLAEAGTRDAFGHAQLGGVAKLAAELGKPVVAFVGAVGEEERRRNLALSPRHAAGSMESPITACRRGSTP